MMLKKKHTVEMLSVAVMAFLLGAMLKVNILTVADKEDDEQPTWFMYVAGVNASALPEVWKINITDMPVDENVWNTIYELQSKVDDLNTSLIELQAEIAESPEIVTVSAYPNWTRITSSEWTDLLSISDVTVSEGVDVLAIATTCLRCTEERVSPIEFRYRADDAYGEYRYQGFAHVWEGEYTEREIIEIHHTWTSLANGTYTFAIQYRNYPSRELDVLHTRLTLVIVR